MSSHNAKHANHALKIKARRLAREQGISYQAALNQLRGPDGIGVGQQPASAGLDGIVWGEPMYGKTYAATASGVDPWALYRFVSEVEDRVWLGLPAIDHSIGGGRRGSVCLFNAKSGAGKTLVATQCAVDRALHLDERSIIFSLEQTRESLTGVVAQQVLRLPRDAYDALLVDLWQRSELDPDEDPSILTLLTLDLPELQLVGKAADRITIIDNVPGPGEDSLPMTPSRIKDLIASVGSEGESQDASLVIIDHLTILSTEDSADIYIDSDAALLTLSNLRSVAQDAGVLMLVLSQAPRAVPPGTKPDYSAAGLRGGAKLLEISDQVLTAWRPEHEPNISEDERLARSGQYMLSAGINRSGPPVTVQMRFEPSRRRLHWYGQRVTEVS